MELTINVPEHQESVRLPGGMLDWSEDDFFEFCQRNRDLRIERNAQGEIIVMSPVGFYSGYESGEVFKQLAIWANRDGTGIAADSSAGFLLPNGGMRAPDASWVLRSRLKALNRKQKSQFPPLAPDFVIEVASPSDSDAELRAKMEEYRQAGVRLGWLLLPDSKTVEIYTQAEVRVLTAPESVSGDPVLPGFELDLSEIWEPSF